MTCGLQAPLVGGLPAAGQMDEEQRMSGLLTGKPVPKIGRLEKASAEMCDPANICILFAFGGITAVQKLHNCLRISMRKVLNNHGIF